MTLDTYLIDELDPSFFEEAYFAFWVGLVLDAMAWLGPETDPKLERLSALVLQTYSGDEAASQALQTLPQEIVRLRGVGFWRDSSPLGLKYRCLNAIGSPIEANRQNRF